MEFKIPEDIIISFIEANFPEVRKTSTGEYHFNNPFEADKKLRFYVNPEKGRFFDQKNQTGGSFSGFVAEYLGVSFSEVAATLITEYSSRNDKEKINYREVIEVKKELELPEGLFFFSEKKDGVMRKRAANYLTRRGIDLSGLGYIYKNESIYTKRVFVPFFEDGRIVYFIARAFDDNPYRYANPHGVDASDVVFNIDKIEDEVFIFEGVFDAMSLKNSVATCMLSNSLKRTQAIKILDKMPNRIIFVLDNDKEIKTRKTIMKSLEKSVNLLKDYKSNYLKLDIYTYRPPEEYKDFNEYYMATGVNTIDIKDCTLWKEKTLDNAMSKLTWGNR